LFQTTLADSGETVVVVPVVVEPVEVELALAVPVIEHRNVAVAIGIAPDLVCAAYLPCHCPSNAFGAVFYSQGLKT